MKPRTLTKTIFKESLKCNARLNYLNQDEYYDRRDGDEFLQELAKGGYQVEELARLAYPKGQFPWEFTPLAELSAAIMDIITSKAQVSLVHGITVADLHAHLTNDQLISLACGKDIEDSAIREKISSDRVGLALRTLRGFLEASLRRKNDLCKNGTEIALQSKDVVLFEAMFAHGNTSARVDILKKTNNVIEIYEVKAKSYTEGETEILTKQTTRSPEPRLHGDLREYVLDVVFQGIIAKRQLGSQYSVKTFLTMVDTSKKASINRLHIQFPIRVIDGQIIPLPDPLARTQNIGNSILSNLEIDDQITGIAKQDRAFRGMGIDQYIDYLAERLKRGEAFQAKLNESCRSCPYRIPEDKIPEDKKSGFAVCAVNTGNIKYDQAFIYDIWKLHQSHSTKLISSGRFLAKEISLKDLISSEHIKLLRKILPELKSATNDSQAKDLLMGLSEESVKAALPFLDSGTKRRMLQIFHARGEWDKPYFFHKKTYEALRSTWTYPLHAIDFETARPAIPVYLGDRSYDLIAFQFSHHVLHADGTVEHKMDWLWDNKSASPNIDFVRALKRSLGDEGSIFRFAPHEQSVLLEIRAGIKESDLPDRDDLLDFIDSITQSKADSKAGIPAPPRNMIDLLEVAKLAYWAPDMGGSNSLKALLPSILNTSQHLQDIYSKPIYGGPNAKMQSRNFTDAPVTWIAKGTRVNPYKSLPPVFAEHPALSDELDDDSLEDVNNGGIAQAAFMRLQFDTLSNDEDAAIRKALKRYCELDTLAMVMLIQAWDHMADSGDSPITEQELVRSISKDAGSRGKKIVAEMAPDTAKATGRIRKTAK